MPYRIDKVKTGYKLYNLDKKSYAKTTFKTRESAQNQSKNWMNYDKEKRHNKQQTAVRNILPKDYKVLSWAVPIAWESYQGMPDVSHPTIYQSF